MATQVDLGSRGGSSASSFVAPGSGRSTLAFANTQPQASIRPGTLAGDVFLPRAPGENVVAPPGAPGGNAAVPWRVEYELGGRTVRKTIHAKDKAAARSQVRPYLPKGTEIRVTEPGQREKPRLLKFAIRYELEGKLYELQVPAKSAQAALAATRRMLPGVRVTADTGHSPAKRSKSKTAVPKSSGKPGKKK